MAKASIIQLYSDGDARARIDIMISNYSNFMEIIESLIEGMVYLVREEKASANRERNGDLGVRVQCGNRCSNPTQDVAISRTEIRDAIVNCDFSGGILDDVEHASVFRNEAEVLDQMKSDYLVLKGQVAALKKSDRDIFLSHIVDCKHIADCAIEVCIGYEAMRKRISRIKKKVIDATMAYLNKTYFDSYKEEK